MRISHLINDLGCGGAEQLVASLAAHQQRAGNDVEVICLRGIGTNPIGTDVLADAGVEIMTLDKPDGVHLGTLRRLKDHLKVRGTEVLHTHNHLVYHYGVVAGRWGGVRAILNTLHGSASLQSSAFWSRGLFGLSCLFGDKLVCVDQKVYDVVCKKLFLPGRKLSVIENGADLARFLSLPRHVGGAAPIFGIIGRLDPVKGHEVLLRAFAIVRRTYPQVRLRILGDGELLEKLQVLARKLSIEVGVSFEGFSPNTPAFLGGIDVYVISSLSEGLPLTLLEAMAAGLPIVATSVGGVTGILEQAKCGWLCPPSSPIALAEEMKRAVTSTSLSEIGARGRMAVENRYSIARMARDYEILYGKLLGSADGAQMAGDPP